MMKRSGKWLVWAVAFVLASYLILQALGVGGWFFYESKYAAELADRTVIGEYPRRMIAAVLAVVTLYGNYLFFKLTPRRQIMGIGINVGIYCLYLAILWAGNRVYYFDPESGEAKKWYVITPQGVSYSDTPGYDQTYGIERRKVTPEIIQSLQRWSGGNRAEQVNPGSVDFFDPATGNALVWYRITRDNTWRFFNGPSYDPEDGAILHPMTQSAYQQWQSEHTMAENARKQAQRIATELRDQQTKEAERSEAIEKLQSGLNAVPGNASWGIVAFDQDHADTVSLYLNEMVGEISEYAPAFSLLTEEGYQHGIAGQLSGGTVPALFSEALGGDEKIRGIVCLQMKVETIEQKDLHPQLVRSSITVSGSVMNMQNKHVERFRDEATGVGFGEQEAIRDALKTLLGNHSKLRPLVTNPSTLEK